MTTHPIDFAWCVDCDFKNSKKMCVNDYNLIWKIDQNFIVGMNTAGIHIFALAHTLSVVHLFQNGIFFHLHSTSLLKHRIRWFLREHNIFDLKNHRHIAWCKNHIHSSVDSFSMFFCDDDYTQIQCWSVKTLPMRFCCLFLTIPLIIYF